MALIWGYNWVVMKVAMSYSGPLEFSAWRCALGVLRWIEDYGAVLRVVAGSGSAGSDLGWTAGYFGTGFGSNNATTSGGQPGHQNIYDPRSDWWPCYFDERQILSSYVTYQLLVGHGKQFGHDMNPTLNAVLNGTAAVLLAWGFLLIRNRRKDQHRRVMIAAFSVSVLFLISYLVYHFNAGVVYFQHQGLIRTVYLSILGTHTALAAAVPVLAIITLNRGLHARFPRHRAIARWTLPIWMYVSVTGVVVYLMLYHY